jgi:ABC-2 type transport system permease protein
MKIFDIALKDLTHSFRSAFALMFMFVIPLLVTGMFYLMFGNVTSSGNSEFQLPKTKVVVANLDQGSPALAESMAALGQAGTAPSSMGEMIGQALQSDAFAQVIEVKSVADAASARQVVDNREAGVAVIFPPDFSAAYVNGNEAKAEIEIYQDPASSLGAGVVKAILGQFSDTLSGMKIAMMVTLTQPGARTDMAAVGTVVQQYMAWSTVQAQNPGATITIRTPPAAAEKPASPITQIVGPIMSGMLIFFAFFTGASSTQTILTEDEEGTLPRLMTTPTTQTTILGGKFLAVALTVLVQVTLLLIAANLVFGIQLGALPSVALTAIGIICCATTFGIFLTSWVKSTRQGGAVYGGLMTVTGMVGMMGIFTGGGAGETVSLVMPQGWAVRGLLMSMNQASLGDVALNLLALLAWSLVFFIIGVLRFQKRFA